MVTTTIRIGIGQGREPLYETIEGIEALAVTDLDQGPEQEQIGIGLDAMCVESMILHKGLPQL